MNDCVIFLKQINYSLVDKLKSNNIDTKDNRQRHILSVITICHNEIDCIEETLQSITEQKCSNYAYIVIDGGSTDIVIDGGSTDRTLDVIKNYESEITYFVSEPDGGRADAMNKGVERSHDEYILFSRR